MSKICELPNFHFKSANFYFSFVLVFCKFFADTFCKSLFLVFPVGGNL